MALPFSYRVDMLKLLYFRKCLQTKNSKLSKIICCKRETSSSIGCCREIFQLCCKYNNFNVWLGIDRIKTTKINTLNEIRRIVEASWFKIDLKKALETQCLYTSLFIKTQASNYKGYKMESFLKQIGNFPDAEGRRFFFVCPSWHM